MVLELQRRKTYQITAAKLEHIRLNAQNPEASGEHSHDQWSSGLLCRATLSHRTWPQMSVLVFRSGFPIPNTYSFMLVPTIAMLLRNFHINVV